MEIRGNLQYVSNFQLPNITISCLRYFKEVEKKDETVESAPAEEREAPAADTQIVEESKTEKSSMLCCGVELVLAP